MYMNIPLADPTRELKHIRKFDSRFNEKLNQGLYVGGDDVTTFENNFKEYIGTKYSISVNSGTDALMFSLISLGIKKGDKVIVPSFTFFATVECVMQLGATPIFVDINLDTYTVDIKDLETKINKEIKAVIPVHLFGNNSNIKEIKNICNKHNVKILEDVAQAFGSETSTNEKLGSIGDLGAFSFFPSKTLGGIGDGGCVTTNNYSFFKIIQKLKNHGQNKPYEHNMVGYNSRLDSLNAFVLNEKLKIFNKIKKSRRTFYDIYFDNLKKYDWMKLPIKQNDNVVLNYFTLQVSSKIRDKFMKHLIENKIGVGIYYKKPVHLQKAVLEKYKKITLKNTEKASKTVISLPFYSFPEEKELEYLLSKIDKFK